ncbi:MAG: beta-Ala-His dipeptidase [Candidatus Eisenbacteria bacterium]|nr:beta-Ala-His dipeptidase [Candidatus Eisenbacteria bacterium]
MLGYVDSSLKAGRAAPHRRPNRARAACKEARSMSYPVEELDPRPVWRYFDKIRQIPHGSGNEEALGNAIVSWIEERGHEAKRDRAGNIIGRIPATSARETAPTVVLQGHIDMVCEKNAGTEFDFEKDPLTLKREGDWITADGTTLGADNGIGVALALAFLDSPDVAHGPLELLLTVDEETGLVGARSLEPDFVTGRLMINLDSEEDGIFYIGCAGGRDTTIRLLLRRQEVTGGAGYQIHVKGLRGGHSGMDIIKNRGNAVRLAARALRALTRELNVSLGGIEGGDKHNAIPREASAVVVIESGDEARAREILAAQLKGFRREFGDEPELDLTAAKTDPPPHVLTPESRDKALQLLLGLPHGVLAMSRDIPGLVETSNNVARVRTTKDRLEILTSSRSSVESALDGTIAQIEAVALAVEADVDMDEGYPGWQPDLDSKLLARSREVWKRVHGKEPELKAVHAGLECGIIGERYPGMDMVSFGPTIENAHSPDEKLHIPSVARYYEFVKELLKELSES